MSQTSSTAVGGASALLPELEREIFSIVKRERMARDTASWAELESLYWSDSRVRVTWFEGTIAEFIAMSTERGKRNGTGVHAINPVRLRVNGDRALVESQGQILIRPRIDGVECDVTSWCRFFSRVERREGEWRLSTFDSIYVKDRIDPVAPDAVLLLESAILAEGRRSYRHLTYLNLKSGYQVPDDLPGDDRPELVEALYAEAERWLRAADN